MAPLLKKLGPMHQDHARICLRIEAVEKLLPNEHNRIHFQVKPSNRVLKPEGTKRIKQMVLEILEKNAGGLKALDILSKIETDYDMKIMRTSLSPQLSRLKKSGDIENRGKLWFIITEKPPANAEGLDDKGAGWSDGRLPIQSVSGSNPDASTPSFAGRNGSQNVAGEVVASPKVQPQKYPERIRKE